MCTAEGPRFRLKGGDVSWVYVHLTKMKAGHTDLIVIYFSQCLLEEIRISPRDERNGLGRKHSKDHVGLHLTFWKMVP